MPMTDERPLQSDRRQLVQTTFNQLGLGDVGAWIQALRDDNVSWHLMSRKLWEISGMEVSYETLRRWHQDDEAAAGGTHT